MLGRPLAVVWKEPTLSGGWETSTYGTTVPTQTLPEAELILLSNFFFHYTG